MNIHLGQSHNNLTPTKRSVASIARTSPTKVTATRRPINVSAAVVKGNNEAVVWAWIPGRDNAEPYVHPFRQAIADMDNPLRREGWFMHVSRTRHESEDIALRTARGYDYKAFLYTSEDDLTSNNYAGLKAAAVRFCEVSLH